MLNALRHQRLLHPQFVVCWIVRVIVLNALRHQRLLHTDSSRARNYGPARAQRLAASKITARGRMRRILAPVFVLNALRHQRLLHWYRRCDSSRRGTVLNALRHQRLLHQEATNRSRPTSIGAQRLAASKITAPRPTGDVRAAKGVLNALRHQRLLHRAGIVFSRLIPTCSTPCGIKDYCTAPLSWLVPLLTCAQRLAASKITALGY